MKLYLQAHLTILPGKRREYHPLFVLISAQTVEKTYQTIASNVTAGDNNYIWNVPDILNTKKCKLE